MEKTSILTQTTYDTLSRPAVIAPPPPSFKGRQIRCNTDGTGLQNVVDCQILALPRHTKQVK